MLRLRTSRGLLKTTAPDGFPCVVTHPQSRLNSSSSPPDSSSQPSSTPTSPFPPHLDANRLRTLVPPRGSWHFTSTSPTSLSRTFHFPSFRNAWAFMDAVAAMCKSRQHHPEWSNSFRTVFVRWTTHRPKGGIEPGLTVKDLDMAEFCDKTAAEWGEKSQEVEGDGNGEVERLVDSVVKEAGDCCGVKRKDGT